MYFLSLFGNCPLFFPLPLIAIFYQLQKNAEHFNSSKKLVSIDFMLFLFHVLFFHSKIMERTVAFENISEKNIIFLYSWNVVMYSVLGGHRLVMFHITSFNKLVSQERDWSTSLFQVVSKCFWINFSNWKCSYALLIVLCKKYTIISLPVLINSYFLNPLPILKKCKEH